ncbi:hypothetical protein [Flavobacterium terrae]|uniref:Uncharacterized protein n=1 Tax=Flavobacterium terrae TaxID=415425 RepID=A0A1M6EUI9_9FLAO|nr:hypothetical protein [Flavobacterium terrae]SHI89155.1 hypothetical protein SAMN05444363_1966 [Flavobacterium terrae]
MKTKLLKINGVETLSKENQKLINGGGPIVGACHCICGKPLPPYCSPCFIDPCAGQDS